MLSDSHLYPRERYETCDAFCPNPNCPGRGPFDAPRGYEVTVVYDMGQCELVDDMPTCDICDTEMVFPDELRHGRRTCSN